jgi:wyosine [tRNA(Phe)-imidazoG37] synthetase (radical SAM superfamily)
MKNGKFKYVFGPVPSRRLGRSLGIDLVPFKTCSYDCIYCQLGPTINKTTQKRKYVPLTDVLLEVYRKIEEGVDPDYITLSGSGEPTLYSMLHDLLIAIKEKTTLPLAVLTNGSLLWDPKVSSALRNADLVVPSLDAGDSEMFRRVNRPHPELPFEKMMEGLIEFREVFTGEIWLEIVLLNEINGTTAEVEKLLPYVQRIQPERIQLNTAIRPPAESYAFPVPKDLMLRFAQMFGDQAEVIADLTDTHPHQDLSVSRESILSLIQRRPCSLEDIVAGLSVHRNEALKHLRELLRSKIITTQSRQGVIFYGMTENLN